MLSRLYYGRELPAENWLEQMGEDFSEAAYLIALPILYVWDHEIKEEVRDLIRVRMIREMAVVSVCGQIV